MSRDTQWTTISASDSRWVNNTTYKVYTNSTAWPIAFSKLYQAMNCSASIRIIPYIHRLVDESVSCATYGLPVSGSTDAQKGEVRFIGIGI